VQIVFMISDHLACFIAGGCAGAKLAVQRICQPNAAFEGKSWPYPWPSDILTCLACQRKLSSLSRTDAFFHAWPVYECLRPRTGAGGPCAARGSLRTPRAMRSVESCSTGAESSQCCIAHELCNLGNLTNHGRAGKTAGAQHRGAS
jgi:hypothetical protein